MSDPSAPILVTAALPYANGPLHLGHLAGAYLPADLFCRYQRLKGRDVAFICGSDEHGVAILIRAMQEGTTPRAVVDRYHAELQEAFRAFGISFDTYGRTTSDEHRRTSQAFFRALDGAGLFTEKTERQLFDPEAGLFLADRFVRGTCPVCGYPDAYGDQCENCGTSLSPSELIEPHSALSGAVPEERETTHWFFPLGAWQSTLEAWISGKTEWKPNVTGQVRSWFEGGLSDRAMTRDLPWGVPVPTADGGEVPGKVLYVWFDAPIGYVSATKEWAAARGDAEGWRRYWQVHEDRTAPRLIHFIGKDNIVFHTVIFPALLMAHNRAAEEAGVAERYVLPADVPANEFLNLEGRKLSTSRGWAVWATEAAEAFPADALRYALATTLPETKDADFSWAEFQARVNGELADVVGNFVHRAVTFARRFAGGALPPLVNPDEADLAVLAALAETPERVGDLYERYRFREAIFETVALARLGNKYFNDAEPWKTQKSDPRRCQNTVHVSLQLCAALAVLMEPVTPDAAARLRAILRLTDVRPSTPGGDGEGIGWDAAARPLLGVGHDVGEPDVLFRKIEDEEVAAQRALLETRAAQTAPATPAADATEPEAPAEPDLPYAEPQAEITIDQFAPIDLRVGKIVAAEPHPKADRLLRFDVDMGTETRQILSGVRAHVTPEEMVGRSVVVVANLAPRTIRGLESHGMILYAENRDGRLVPVVTEGEPGAVVK